MMKKWFMVMLAVFLLTACNNKEENLSPEEAAKVIDEGTVGFEVMGGEVKEASEVPKEEQEKIISSFNNYIQSFISEDIESYKRAISTNPKGFDYEKDLEYIQNLFASYDTEVKASDITIIKYEENEAQVYANLEFVYTEDGSNVTENSSSRQVTVFVKEDEEWKVTSVHSIENRLE